MSIHPAATRTIRTLLVLCATSGFEPAFAQVNDPPDVTLPSPVPDTAPVTPVTFAVSVSDPDVGAGNMEMEIDISDLDGPGGLSVVAGDYGRFSWGLGTGVTSDVAVVPIGTLNTALANFTYTPAPTFAGVARIVFEIDDQGNTGTGGVLSRTRFIDIDVCAAAELGTPACATNAAPDITLPSPAPDTPQGAAVAVPTVVSDVDVGAGNMEMEIDISDLDGVGGLSVPAGDYGTFSWSFGTGVTSDVAVAPLATINAALAGLVYTPNPVFSGVARIVFEIDDRGNAGTGGTLSRTRLIDIDVVISPGSVRFTRCVVSVGEGASPLFPVERADGTSGAASVEVMAMDDSAGAADYSVLGGSLAWLAAQGGVRTAQVQIVADGLAERTERFSLFLAAPTGATLGAPSIQTVFVRDIAAAVLVFADGIEGSCTP